MPRNIKIGRSFSLDRHGMLSHAMGAQAGSGRGSRGNATRMLTSIGVLAVFAAVCIIVDEQTYTHKYHSHNFIFLSNTLRYCSLVGPFEAIHQTAATGSNHLTPQELALAAISSQPDEITPNSPPLATDAQRYIMRNAGSDQYEDSGDPEIMVPGKTPHEPLLDTPYTVKSDPPLPSDLTGLPGTNPSQLTGSPAKIIVCRPLRLRRPLIHRSCRETSWRHRT